MSAAGYRDGVEPPIIDSKTPSDLGFSTATEAGQPADPWACVCCENRPAMHLVTVPGGIAGATCLVCAGDTLDLIPGADAVAIRDLVAA